MSSANADLAEEIRSVRFRPVRLREGYAMGDVDEFLDRLAAAADGGQVLAPIIDAARFTPVRLRNAYEMGEVDKFLARVGSGATSSPTSVQASVIEERRSLFERLFGRH